MCVFLHECFNKDAEYLLRDAIEITGQIKLYEVFGGSNIGDFEWQHFGQSWSKTTFWDRSLKQSILGMKGKVGSWWKEVLGLPD